MASENDLTPHTDLAPDTDLAPHDDPAPDSDPALENDRPPDNDPAPDSDPALENDRPPDNDPAPDPQTEPAPRDETAEAPAAPVRRNVRKRAVAKVTTPAEGRRPGEEHPEAGDDETADAATPTKRPRSRLAGERTMTTAAERPGGERAGPPAVVDEEALRFDALETPPTGPDAERVPSPRAGDDAPTLFGPLFQAPDPGPRVPDEEEQEEEAQVETPRRRRRRGGKGRHSRASAAAEKRSGARAEESSEPGTQAVAERDAVQPDAEGGEQGEQREQPPSGEDAEAGATTRRRTRRRRRTGTSDAAASLDEPGVTTKMREARRDEVTGLKGSTRLEAKKQRRREGREAGRRRTIITEAEFLARRENVERVMVVRRLGDRTQIGVLEDGVLVEHYISRETAVSMAGNIYLGRIQNVLPSMEAAFVDIGKGRNAVLYAGEVNWDAAGLEANQPKRIENALTSGESVLVQVTKDPMGHKGARLTSQISLPGRYLVYVPDSSMTGISRKLPDTERTRLKKILKEVLPDTAGVIVRTAAEGASEEELRADVERLTATWEDIRAKAEAAASGSGKKKKDKSGGAPVLLHGEPDLTVRVIRDIFNEDFTSLVVAGEEAWQEVSDYVGTVAPDLAERVTRWTSEEDLFGHYRVDEQIAKAMDRKVWLPSGGSLVIDRTEAMTVVDVNTGKFIGSGGNLEETVTKNNLEAAEEIVRQLRLRDIGGIIVIDFIDMVLESNRDLVVRRLLECLGRDRTKHQVAEVTSLGLVQMTRKRVGSGLIEVFSEVCETCGGRGIIVHSEPVDRSGNGPEAPEAASGRGPNTRGRGGPQLPDRSAPSRPTGPTPAQIAAAAHAAALKTTGYATVPAGEPGSPSEGAGSAPAEGESAPPGLPASQDEPLEVVREVEPTESDDSEEPDVEELDIAELDTEPVDIAELNTEPVDIAEPDTQPSATAEPDARAVSGDGSAHEATRSGTTDMTGEAGAAGQASDMGRPADAPTGAPVRGRPRRHRGRVVSPAGPPRHIPPDQHDEHGAG